MFRGGTGMDILTDGAAVTLHGHISFYEARGSIDFLVDIVLVEGVGPRALEFAKLKSTLEQEGLFDPSRKRPLPRFPKTIGVITSPSGVVLQDICNVLNRRYPLVELQLALTLVQGPEAAEGITRALNIINDNGTADLIIVARGGGSLEELWAFNEESVARTIYGSQIPVVSGIGHETDYTIADFVADVRAPTPSAAAEIVVPDKIYLRAELFSLSDRLFRATSSTHLAENTALTNMVSRLTHNIPDFERYRRDVDGFSQQNVKSMSTQLYQLSQHTDGLRMRLEALNPKATLNRGYSIVHNDTSGEVISLIEQVQPNDPFKVTVSNGTFPAIAGETTGIKRSNLTFACSDEKSLLGDHIPS